MARKLRVIESKRKVESTWVNVLAMVEEGKGTERKEKRGCTLNKEIEVGE